MLRLSLAIVQLIDLIAERVEAFYVKRTYDSEGYEYKLFKLKKFRAKLKRWPKTPDQWTGKRGEWAAVRYLKRKKYIICERNFFFEKSRAEIDIIAKDKDCVVFVEVKTTAQAPEAILKEPREAVDLEKQRNIISCARYYVPIASKKRYALRDKTPTEHFRFDVIEVYLKRRKKPVINHIENAFYITKGTKSCKQRKH